MDNIKCHSRLVPETQKINMKKTRLDSSPLCGRKLIPSLHHNWN